MYVFWFVFAMSYLLHNHSFWAVDLQVWNSFLQDSLALYYSIIQDSTVQYSVLLLLCGDRVTLQTYML